MFNQPDAYLVYKLDQVEVEPKVTVDLSDGCIYINEDEDDE